jgi:hypothetical protein
MMRRDSLATKRVSRNRRARFAADNVPAGAIGKTFARQRISSAIQFPMPAKPLCNNKTAFTGARAWRRKKASKNARSNVSEAMSGAPDRHQSGADFPW